MELIVVAIDFSQNSLNALRIAANLATASKAGILMVHICRSCDDDTLNPSERTRRQKREVDAKMEELVQKYRDKLEGRISYKVHGGRIYKGVVNQAKYSTADLIIAGTHGISGFEEFFMGSNAYRIVTSSHCPVLTINEDYMKDSFGSILLPIDSSKDTRQKVPFTARMAIMTGANIKILGISSYDDENLKHGINIYCKQAADYFQKKGVPAEIDFTEGRKISEVVLDYASKNGADLISIMSDIESDSFSRLLSSDVQRIVNQSLIPVLVSHPHENFNYQISFTGITG